MGGRQGGRTTGGFASHAAVLLPRVSPGVRAPSTLIHDADPEEIFRAGADRSGAARGPAPRDHDVGLGRTPDDARLVQRPYDNDWLALGNDGDHIGSLAPRFARDVLAPLVLEEANGPSAATRSSATQPGN